MTRSSLRDVIIKCLYQIYIYNEKNISYDLNSIISDNIEVSDPFVDTCINGVIKNQDTITKLANQYIATGWSIDRLSKVDKAILSLGIYELKYTDTPGIVAINEAVELAKKYSDEKVIKMINAVLDIIYKEEEDNGR